MWARITPNTDTFHAENRESNEEEEIWLIPVLPSFTMCCLLKNTTLLFTSIVFFVSFFKISSLFYTYNILQILESVVKAMT